MASKTSWVEIIVAIVGGLILGIGSTLFFQEGRIVKLETQLDELRNRLKENSVSITPSTKTPEAIQPTAAVLSKNTELTNAAWDAFKKLDYVASIEKAKECINIFEIQALQEQKDFSEKKLPPPPLGRPANDSKKEEVLSRGVLNDVATCYFIKGQALEKLVRIDEAKEAYKETRKFPDARAWDVAGFFWAPAVGATNNLSKLQ